MSLSNGCKISPANEADTTSDFLNEELYPGPKVIKLFPCSTQLSMKFKLLINIEVAKIEGIFRCESLKPVIYPANKN